ncbi:FAD-dependent oxidoreductase [Nocardia arthritidis]|uniref:FAD-dependent monooxygenase n=1 Tax=Nocardia arthritidis TaxID=228602 RepID=A0A6G9YM85_9NOCA|nr:FAD-dependent monooxygenase [Nocardia arthritidis]QIS14318.1 FAD-dependent monooxygenase [Nocardia arthritidis]
MPTNEPLKVIVAGGGIGGLALANGLRRAGVQVSVHERDTLRTDRLQGFRIHISPHGSRALAELLSPEMYSTFVASSGKGGNGLGFMTEQLKTLLQVDPEEPDENPAGGGHFGISRITLRQILLAELGDTVRYDSMFERYERLPDGRVVAHFADGGSEIGDVLVGADGGTSRVRAQYLPYAQRVETGIVAIAGKYALTPESRERLDARLLANPTSIMPPSGCGMFIAPHEFDIPARAGIGETEAGAEPGLLFDNTQPYIFWAYAAKRERYGVDLDALRSAELHELAGGMTADWAPELRFLIRASDSDATTLIPIKTSVPIEPWQTTNITLLGDAIHSMTPFRGIGANTALRDARLLCRNLIAADRRELALLDGIRDYERQMIDYGFQAVRDSLTAANQTVSDSRFGRHAGKVFFRTANAIPAIKRKIFADLDIE